MIEVVMPKFGLTMSEGEITEWHVPENGVVARGSILFTVMTEKVETEVEAPADGTLTRILAPVGSIVPVGAAVAIITPTGASGGTTQ